MVTLYGADSERIQALTGNENGGNGRILLLDGRGEIRWFWDQGYSSKRLLELLEVARSLDAPASPTQPAAIPDTAD